MQRAMSENTTCTRGAASNRGARLQVRRWRRKSHGARSRRAESSLPQISGLSQNSTLTAARHGPPLPIRLTLHRTRPEVLSNLATILAAVCAPETCSERIHQAQRRLPFGDLAPNYQPSERLPSRL